MRGSTQAFFGWFTIAIILFAIPELPTIIPSAHAALITGPTPWRPYGPYSQQVRVSVFYNRGSELQAFQRGQLDWVDSPTLFPFCPPGPLAPCFDTDIAHTPPEPEADMFQIDINHHNNLFGIPLQQPRTTSCTQIPDCGIEGLPGSTVEPTPYGILVEQALAHLIDKVGFVNSGACASVFCVPIDDPLAYPVCLYGTGGPVAPCSTIAQRAAWDTLSPTCPVGSVNPCAYRVAPGPGGGYPSGYPCPTTGGIQTCASGSDMQASKDHLLAAGLAYAQATGNPNPLTLDPATGKFNFPTASSSVNPLAFPGQVVFKIRTDDAKRRLLGTILADAIDSIFDAGPFGVPVVFRGPSGRIRDFCNQFLSSSANCWNLYTGGWLLGLDATHFNPLYDSAFATNFCGGAPSYFNLNYGYYCNPAFNLQERRATFNALSSTSFNSEMQMAADIAGRTVMTIPVYTRAAPTVAHNGWAGLVDAKEGLGIGAGSGPGFSSNFNWFNMRQKPDYCATPPNCTVLGPPGGGNPNLLRAGFSFGTSNLNIFQAGTLTEGNILSQIYDTPGHFNPRAVQNPFFDPYEALVTSVGEVFCTAGSCSTALGQPGFTVPGVPATEPVTVIQLTFRNDILFHDGVHLTAQDYVASILAYRDVPQGGFGEAAAFANLLAPSSTDPKAFTIPGSNCGNLCVQLVFDGQSFLNKLNALNTPILPLHVWDTDGDGFICSTGRFGSCADKKVDFSTPACNALPPPNNFPPIAFPPPGCVEVTGPDFDPMASGFMIGSGPFQCLDLDTSKPGGSCTRTSFIQAKGGQSIGPGGSFLLTRFDGYLYCCPTDPNGGTLGASTPLGRFAAADLDHDWKIDALDLSAAVATNNPGLISAVVGQLEDTLGGSSGRTLNDVDLTNTGNSYTIS